MNETFYRNLLDNLMDGVYFVDTDRKITYWNKGAERITGYSPAEVEGSQCFDNLLNHVDYSGRQLCQDKCPLAETIEDGRLRKEDLFLQHKNGERIPVSVRIAPLKEGGRIIGAVESFSDNSAKVAALQRVEHLMQENLTDPLTGIGNRRYAEITLQNRFDEISRYNWRFGLLFFDIDHFKQVNDDYGHAAGDAVLKAVADDLARNIRSFDFVGRWGGEEFIILLVNIDSRDILIETADRFRMLVESSHIAFHDKRIQVTVSVGVTISHAEDTIDSLLNRADTLMYESKRNGRNRITFG